MLTYVVASQHHIHKVKAILLFEQSKLFFKLPPLLNLHVVLNLINVRMPLAVSDSSNSNSVNCAIDDFWPGLGRL